jgi:hypothetical protein
MSGSVGRFAVWDDTSNHPTHRVRDVPARSDEDETRHIHIHLPAEIMEASRTRDRPARSRRGDANANAPGEETPAPRRNGNGPQPRLLARLLQNGEDGSWAATDAEGNPLVIRTASDGALEVIHHPDYEEQNGDADPEEMGIERPPGAAALDRQRRLGARALDALTRTGFCQDPYLATQEYAIRMKEAFAQKRRG